MREYFERNFSKIFFSLIAIFLLIKACFLIYPNLNISYPFLAPDSYDWIANGLHYGGYDVNFSFRPPALPLIIALLDSLGILELLPVLNQLALFLILLVFYMMIARRFSPLTGIVTTAIVFFNFFLQNLSLYILADTYALLFMLAGCYFYMEAENDEKRYLSASLSLCVSYIFQSAVIFVIPAIILHYLVFRRRARLTVCLRAVLPPLLLIGGWLVWKRIQFGTFLGYGTQQLKLLKLHFDSLFFYLINTVSVLGVLVFLLVVFGLFVCALLKDKRIIHYMYLNVMLSVSWVIFWVFLYTWNDRRFIIYLMFFILPFASAAIHYLISRFERANALGKLLLAALLIATVYSTAIPYDSCFTLDRIKITGTTALKFKSVTDETTCNTKVVETSFHLIKDRAGYNPINVRKIYLARRGVDSAEIDRLKRIREEIIAGDSKILCLRYKSYDKFRWYIDKNRYGNFFKRKLSLYPGCGKPNLIIAGGRIKFKGN